MSLSRRELLAITQRVIDRGRADFRAMASSPDDDPETIEFIDALTQAIGDISPDEAVSTLLAWREERHRDQEDGG